MQRVPACSLELYQIFLTDYTRNIVVSAREWESPTKCFAPNSAAGGPQVALRGGSTVSQVA